MDVGGRNGVGVEQRVLAIVRRADGPDCAVDDDMSNMDSLWRQLVRHALRETTQRELAHCESGRVGESLEPRRRAREKHRTVPVGQHASHGMLGDSKGGNCCDVGRASDRLGIDLDERCANAMAGVVDDDVGRSAKRQRGSIE